MRVFVYSYCYNEALCSEDNKENFNSDEEEVVIVRTYASANLYVMPAVPLAWLEQRISTRKFLCQNIIALNIKNNV